MKIPEMVRHFNMFFNRFRFSTLFLPLILLGFSIFCPVAKAADWTTAQIRDLLSDVNTIRINTGSATSILGTIDGVLIDIETAINTINNSSLEDVNYYLQSLDNYAHSDNQLLIGLSSDLFQMKVDVENGFNLLSNILSSIDSSISNLSSLTNGNDSVVLDNIYSALSTNELSFVGQTYTSLTNFQSSMEHVLDEIGGTNYLNYIELANLSTNLLTSIHSLTNDLAGVTSKLDNIDTTLSSLSSITNYLDTFLLYTTNTFTNLIVPFSINRTTSNDIVNQFNDQFSNFYMGDYTVDTFITMLDEGLFWVPTSLNTSSGASRNLFNALNSIYGNAIYQTYFTGKSSEIAINSYNNITNKSQSIVYTTILPEISAATGEPNIYSALTNAYLTSYNQQSDKTWFDRVELLLAALVFPDTSATNTVENAYTAQSASEQNAQQFSDQFSQVTSALVNSNPQGEFQYISGHISTLLSTLKQNLVFRKPEIISVSTLEEPLDVLGERPTDVFVVDTTFGGLSGFIDFLRNLTSLLWVVLFFVFAYKAVLVIFKAYYTFYNFSQAIFRKILG